MRAKGKGPGLWVLAAATVLALLPGAEADGQEAGSSSARLGRLLSGAPPARPPERPELRQLEQAFSELAALPGAGVAVEAIAAGRQALTRARAAVAAGDERLSRRATQLARAALELASRQLAAHNAVLAREAAARRAVAAEQHAAEAARALESARAKRSAQRASPP